MRARQTFVLIQSRLASTRLPAKALLPIGGIPSVVLCAHRASNSGLKVIVVTSEEALDNEIALTLESAGLACFRGPHDDVLKRFVLAIASLNDDDLVVRLTADNVFPDGEFIDRLLHSFSKNKVDYLSTSSPVDGLPYGLSAEVFTAAVLRKAEQAATSKFDREHVTPWIRRNFGAPLFTMHDIHCGWARLRCTLDSFDDYKVLLQVFEGVTNPVDISWRELVLRLDSISSQFKLRCPLKVLQDGTACSEITFGAAQLGMTYGIANKTGMLSDQQSTELLQQAIELGITAFDTARAYGESELRIGHLLSPGYRDRINVITKLDVLAELPNEASPGLVRKLVDESIFHSCHSLKRTNIDTLLLHRWKHHNSWNGVAWARLIEHKNAGLIRRLGVSVTQPEEAMAALKDFHITHIQAPINILDWRWRDGAFLAAVDERPDVIWHARSVFLQGLLLLPAKQWPKIPKLNSEELSEKIDTLVKKLGRKDRIDLCIAYIRSLSWVTSLVIGIDNVDQLYDSLEKFQLSKLTSEQQAELVASLPEVPEVLLNPSRWEEF